MDDPWEGSHSKPSDPEPHFMHRGDAVEGTSHTVALYQVGHPKLGLRVRYQPGGCELGIRILETVPGTPAAVANRLAGQRYADDHAAGRVTGPFQGLGAGCAIIAALLPSPGYHPTILDTPASIAAALRTPSNGLTLLRIAQDLSPDLGWQPGTRVDERCARTHYITLNV